MRRIVQVLVLVALAAVGIAAGAVLAPGGSASSSAPAATTTAVTVTATEFKFKLSRTNVPTGTVIFTVVNKGKIAHDFKIAGKKTPTLSPGKSFKLNVTFSKKGRYAFLCTLLGHAGAGMKGTFSVAAPPVTTPPPTTTTPTTTTTPPPPPTGTVGTAVTTVQVSMTDYAFTMSQSTIPSGQVTFVIKNNGSDVHNFDISGVKAGAILSGGQSETWTVALPAKPQYPTVCDVPFHVDRGMSSVFTVTP